MPHVRSLSHSVRSALTRTALAALLVLLCAGSASAAPIFLSDFLGVPSGQSTFASNPPFTTVVSAPNAFGADIPGNFATNQITFSDAGPFAKGIGAAPDSEINFDLTAFRALGESFDRFQAVIGIDQPSGGSLGATFTVFVDGVLVLNRSVVSVNSPSVMIDVDVSGGDTLTLQTMFFGGVFGNHAAWADAKLVLVPEPSTLIVLAVGGFMLASRRRVA